MLGKKLGIDLGSAEVRVFVRGEGVVLIEPTVVAMRADGTPAGPFGSAALGRNGSHDAEPVRPIRQGAIVDENAVRELIQLLVLRAVGRQRIFKPDMVISVMSTMSGAHRRALLDAATRAGARTAYLLDAPIAAFMGSGHAPGGNQGHLVIDAGGGKTEVCALAEEGTIAGRCFPSDMIVDDGYVAQVSAALHQVLAEVPHPLLADIRREGIVLCGGGARRGGLDRRLAESSGIAVRVADEPQLCAVRGAGLAVDNLDLLKRNFMYLR